jgi:hypothetical protein
MPIRAFSNCAFNYIEPTGVNIDQVMFKESIVDTDTSQMYPLLLKCLPLRRCRVATKNQMRSHGAYGSVFF